jgi:WD40 repeat protein
MLNSWQADNHDSNGVLAYSPGGQFLALGSDEGLGLWDASTGRLVRSLIGRQGPNADVILDVAISPDGRLVAAALHLTGSVRVWDAATGNLVIQLRADPHPIWPDNPLNERSDFFTCVAFSRDGQRIAAGGTYKVFHDRDSPECKAFIARARRSPWFLGFAGPDHEKYLVENRGRVRCWDLESGRQVAKLDSHELGVEQVSFLEDGRVVSFSEDGELWVWDVEAVCREKEIMTSEWPRRQSAVAFGADGRHAVLSRPGSLALIDLVSGEEVRTFSVGPNWTYRGREHLTLSADARWVVTESDGRVQIWDASTGTDLSPVGRHARREVAAVRFSADGRVVTATWDDAILWDPATGKKLSQLRDCRCLQLGALALSPDGSGAACVRRIQSSPGVWDRDNVITWDWRSLEVRTWEDAGIAQIVWSRDGTALLLVSKQGDLYVLDLLTGQRKPPANRPTGTVESIAQSSVGRLLAILDASRSVHVWEQSPGGWHRQLNIPNGARKPNCLGKVWGSLLFSPDGQTLALASANREICLGPVDGPELPIAFSMPPPSEDFAEAFTMGFLPTGGLLVARSCIPGGEEEAGPETIRIFDVATRCEVWVSPPLGSHAHALAFSPDGRRLASGLSDGTTLLWDIGVTMQGPSPSMLPQTCDSP